MQILEKKLNIVNQGLLNPDKFKNANQQDIEEIHNFVMSKDSFHQAKLQQLLMSWGTYVKIREDDDMTSLSYNEKLQQYAELLVKIGMNVQPKQPVLLDLQLMPSI